MGAAGTPLIRSTFAAYGDGRDTPAGANRPNPRLISNLIVAAATQPDNDRDMSTLVYIWGQVGTWSSAIASASGDCQFVPYYISISHSGCMIPQDT